MADADALGAPPDRGLVVRPEDHGFYVRLQPVPAPQAGRVLGVALLFGALGGVIGLIASPALTVRVWMAVGSVAFGLLLYAFSFGQGFFPVELIGDERCLAWAGDRFMWASIGGADAEGGTLRLRSPDGRVLAEAHHLEPRAAAWVAKLIRASAQP